MRISISTLAVECFNHSATQHSLELAPAFHSPSLVPRLLLAKNKKTTKQPNKPKKVGYESGNEARRHSGWTKNINLLE